MTGEPEKRVAVLSSQQYRSIALSIRRVYVSGLTMHAINAVCLVASSIADEFEKSDPDFDRTLFFNTVYNP